MLTADSVARFAALLGDRTRAQVCLALLDGRAWTAGELARHVGVAPSTASEHLTQLVDAGVLAQERAGRHRYVRLADPAIAQVVEDLAGAVGAPERPTSLRTARASVALRAARTCYDHLAGELGVAVLDAAVERRLVAVDSGLALTAEGRAWAVALLGPAALSPGGRPLLRTCLYWTERRPHLSGALGAALLRELLRREWVVRRTGSRALQVTVAGRAGLAEVLGVGCGGV